jgi:dolichol-phosphate mannosyltransferase
LWEAVNAGHDAAFGVRAQRQDPTLRLWLTRLIRQVLPLLFGVRVQDANVPFKLLTREIWTMARPMIPEDTLAPSLFLALAAAKRNYRIAYLPVAHRERATGVVSIRRWKLLKFCARAFRQLITFRSRLLA